MKRFFLYAVAIAALCSSCETEDEAFATETNNQTNTLHHAKGVEVNEYQIYQSILNSFVYNFENNTHPLNTKLEKDAKGLIKIKIKGGRVSKGCTGFGICALSAGGDFGIIEIEITYGDQTTLSANVNEVNQKNIKEYFGKNAFILEEDFEITDTKTKEALGIRNFTIRKGVYEVRDGKVTFLSTAN